ncbi:S8 family serine peptidase [Mangrovihabitans endophyticus]|uniref:Peptidase S8/S53 domain-containing protein n=1 Tax=Mangrovihabitans endophyticus TaxID=1751298 RepID=A0A8J3FNE8_9ACTN|nr:S8 family serine peptidase [Mangrovihabitans endophyticus]GGK92341.1 hypothetical protein GCM10012284_27710 [Mangrovihabitans endophyticus]
MRNGAIRRFGIGLLAGGLVATAYPAAAHAAPAPDPEPVSLIVGLRHDADVVDRLTDDDVDVLDSEEIGDAVAVDVPATQVTDAAATLRADPAIAYVEPDHTARVARTTPRDPGFRSQWGAVRADVDDAWDLTRGVGGVVVAVVDTGVKPLPDFASRLLTGYDFVNEDSNAYDDNGHGTMAAGVLAASGNNGTGVAGICWYCKILPVKVLGADGVGSYSDIAEGIRYAADRGANVINLSLGGSADSQLLRDAVDYATGRGSLVIAAAGNAGSSQRHYPAAIPAVLAIGASTSADTRYSWSNYGSDWVDLAAPGCNPAQDVGGRIGWFCGTSSATPFAAGVAALLASTTPEPGPAVIREAMESSGRALSGGWTGAGRVDADDALRALPFWLSGVSKPLTVGNSLTLRPHVASASGITEVVAELDGDVLATSTAEPWTLRVNTRAVTGSATLTVTAKAGSTVLATAAVRITADHTGPRVAFVAPRRGALVRGVVRAGARASDPAGISKIQLVVGGRVVSTDTTWPYQFTWKSGSRNGRITLMLRAFDRLGNVSRVSQVVTRDNARPSARILGGPASGRKVRGTARLTVRGSDANRVARMELLVNGRVVQRTTASTYRFSVPTWRYGRRMTVRVRVYDRAWNAAYTPTRTWYR